MFSLLRNKALQRTRKGERCVCHRVNPTPPKLVLCPQAWWRMLSCCQKQIQLSLFYVPMDYSDYQWELTFSSPLLFAIINQQHHCNTHAHMIKKKMWLTTLSFTIQFIWKNMTLKQAISSQRRLWRWREITSTSLLSSALVPPEAVARWRCDTHFLVLMIKWWMLPLLPMEYMKTYISPKWIAPCQLRASIYF